MSLSADAVQGSPKNPFLSPLIERWRATPQRLFGMFHDGDDWHRLETDAFMRRALQFSALYAGAGVGSGDIVLIIMEHGIDAHACFVGAMLIGAVPAFMPSPSVKQDADLYWRQHREVFSHAQPRAILVYDRLAEAVSEAASGTGAAILAASAVESHHPAALGALPDAKAIALLQHSSGTTGLKKGVKLSYQAIHDQLAAYRIALSLDEVAEPRFASWLPLYHDMGLISSFMMPLWRGIPILSIDPFEWTRRPALLFEAIEQFRGTHAWVPNFALRHHVKSARPRDTYDLSSLVALIGCSEPNKPEAFDSFVERFAAWGVTEATPQGCYAMAETVFAMSQTRIGEKLRRLAVDRDALQKHGEVRPPADDAEPLVLLSNGKPIPGCRIAILHAGDFTGERVVGEVCVTAPYLFSGYHNSPALSEQAFFGEWLRTGDLGFLDGGEVFIVGRLKDVIILNGKNVFAHDVEAAISRVPQIKPGRAVAFGHYMQALGSEQLVIVAECLDWQTDPDHIAQTVNRVVSQDVGVTCGDVRLVEQGWLVKTTSGKVSRSENLKKYLAMIESGPA